MCKYKAACSVLETFEKHGFEAYIVGGYPRDSILGRDTLDLDLCTSATPAEIKNIFPDLKLDNEQYGAVIVKHEKYNFEVTTFRRDMQYIDHRKPGKTEYVRELREDLLRRDLTINTLCMNKDGEIIDLLNGKEDINRKLIRSVGNADIKLEEDTLRILRSIRFATVLDFELDKNIVEAILKHGHLLKSLSVHRKKEELTKIFLDKNAKKGVQLLLNLNLAEPLGLENLDKLVITTSMVSIWAQLGVINKYPFSKIEKSHIEKTIECLQKPYNDLNLFYYGLYISNEAASVRGIEKRVVTEAFEALPIKRRNEIAITTDQICVILNKEPGAFLHDIMEDLVVQIVNRNVLNEKDELMSYVKEKYQ